MGVLVLSLSTPTPDRNALDEVEIPRIRKFGHKNTLIGEGTNGSGASALLTVVNRLVASLSSLEFLFRVNNSLIQSH